MQHKTGSLTHSSHSSRSSRRSSTRSAATVTASLVERQLREQGEEELDANHEIVMAVDLKERGTVGCCYYVARDEKMYFMEDSRMGGVDVVDALKMYIEPTVILVSSKIDDEVIEKLDPEAGSKGSESGGTLLLPTKDKTALIIHR